MPADQRTIAHRLSLSTTTVCRSLKDDPAIHPDTRAKVKAMASELGYRVRGSRAEGDAIRQSTSDERPQLTHIGVLIISDSPPRSLHQLVWNRVMFGMSQAASSLRASLHVAYAGGPGEVASMQTLQSIPMLSDRAVGGLIVMGQVEPAALEQLQREFACLRIIHHDPDAAVDCVNHDDAGAMLRLVRHLRDAGHQRIGFATSDSVRARSYVQARYGGYVSALAGLGLAFDPNDSIGITTDATANSAATDIAAGIERGVKAWIGIHDGMGYAVMNRLAERGLHAPRDYAMCGFDDFDPPAGLPKLTSMAAPFESMGMAAVHRLLHRIKHPASDAMQMMFPAKFVQGQSTTSA